MELFSRENDLVLLAILGKRGVAHHVFRWLNLYFVVETGWLIQKCVDMIEECEEGKTKNNCEKWISLINSNFAELNFHVLHSKKLRKHHKSAASTFHN